MEYEAMVYCAIRIAPAQKARAISIAAGRNLQFSELVRIALAQYIARADADAAAARAARAAKRAARAAKKEVTQ